MTDVTQIVAEIEHGDPDAAERLLPLIYDELRKLADAWLAQEKPGRTLQATALVHEAYLRLTRLKDREQQSWQSRGHFFAATVEVMRRILIAQARHNGRLKARRRATAGRPQLGLRHIRSAVSGFVSPGRGIVQIRGHQASQSGIGQAPLLWRSEPCPKPRRAWRLAGHGGAVLDVRSYLAVLGNWGPT